MTHLACAEAATLEETHEQMLRFDEATALLLAARGPGPGAPRRQQRGAPPGRRRGSTPSGPGIALFGVSPACGGEALTGELGR